MNGINPTKKLVCYFLHDFSRFEYALKRSDFLKKGASGNAEVNWDTFANSLDDVATLQTIEQDEFRDAVEYFFVHPPKRQVVSDGGGFEWEEYQAPPESRKNFAELLKLVRRVRNNLFHGGKFLRGYIKGSERDEALLKHSLVILRECLKLNEDVQREYEN